MGFGEEELGRGGLGAMRGKTSKHEIGDPRSPVAQKLSADLECGWVVKLSRNSS